MHASLRLVLILLKWERVSVELVELVLDEEPHVADDPVEAAVEKVADHPQHAQTSVLLQTPSGKTVFVTIGCGSAKEATLQLLIVGTHGVAQLEGAGEFRD